MVFYILDVKSRYNLYIINTCNSTILEWAIQRLYKIYFRIWFVISRNQSITQLHMKSIITITFGYLFLQFKDKLSNVLAVLTINFTQSYLFLQEILDSFYLSVRCSVLSMWLDFLCSCLVAVYYCLLVFSFLESSLRYLRRYILNAGATRSPKSLGLLDLFSFWSLSNCSA